MKAVVTLTTVLIGVVIVSAVGIFSWWNERPLPSLCSGCWNLGNAAGRACLCDLGTRHLSQSFGQWPGQGRRRLSRVNFVRSAVLLAVEYLELLNSAVTITFVIGGPMGQIYNEYLQKFMDPWTAPWSGTESP